MLRPWQLKPMLVVISKLFLECVRSCWNVSKYKGYRPSCSVSLPGEAGVRGERSLPVGQRADVALCAGAEPPPAGPFPWGDPEAEAAPADPEEPRLRRQLPCQARVPAGGAGAAEDGATEGGGAARRRERRHAEGAGGAGRAAGRPAAVCPRPGGRRRHAAGHGAAPQHRFRHHHRQESAAAAATERAGAVLGEPEPEPEPGGREGGGVRWSAMQTHTEAWKFRINTQDAQTGSVGKY